jgi:hypothetical protein
MSPLETARLVPLYCPDERNKDEDGKIKGEFESRKDLEKAGVPIP